MSRCECSRPRCMQFFFKYSSSKEADNLPACMACVADEFDTFRRRDEVLQNPEEFFNPDQPLFSTQRVRPRHPTTPLSTLTQHHPQPP